MGIFDFIKDVTEVVSTRSGRESMLGIPANKRDRAIRERAVKEFIEQNPEFLVSGSTADFDGYVQYINNKEKHCVFIEGERNCWKARDYYLEKFGYESAFLDITADQLIPKIEDLFASHRAYFKKRIIEERFLINVVLAQIWLDKLFLESEQEQSNKKNIWNSLVEMIENHELPFYSVVEIEKYARFAELLAISKLMNNSSALLPFNDPDVQLTSVQHDSFESLRTNAVLLDIQIQSQKIRWWQDYFEKKHGVVVRCQDELRIDTWA